MKEIGRDRWDETGERERIRERGEDWLSEKMGEKDGILKKGDPDGMRVTRGGGGGGG